MSNNATSRRPSGPVRQHSLQQPPHRQQQIRRQRSADDEKNIQHHSSNNKFTSNSKKSNHHLDRPKVRIAWGEQPTKSKNDGVEIIARQIPTNKSNRPTTAHNRGIMGRCPLAEKATILYSRQELAERLRLAWRQRQENKSNIDIFLAHNTVEDRCDSRLSTNTNPAITSPTSKVQKEDRDSEQVDITVEEPPTNEESDPKKDELNCENLQELKASKHQTWFSSFESNEPSSDITEHVIVNDHVSKIDENKENDEIKLNEDEESEPIIEKKSCISINCDWKTSLVINNNPEVIDDSTTKSSLPLPIKEQDYSQARLKRANYQSGLNKAFITPVNEKPSTPRITSRSNSIQDPMARFRRTSSAPPQRRTQVNIVIETSGISSRIIDNEPEKRVMSASEKSTSRPIKSALAVKRRSKFSKKRGLSTASSKDGDDDADNGKGKSKSTKGSKNLLESKNIDVITMVSLVSSADSESEIDENSPRDDKLICELRNKLPTNPIIKSSNGLSGGIRKPFKSVSFQQDSFDCDSPPRQDSSRDDQIKNQSSNNTLQARYAALSKAAAATAVDDNTPLLTAAAMTMNTWKTNDTSPALSYQPKSYNVSETVDVPLTDREKRCLAVPIGDNYDKKRKLIRCRSAVVTTRVHDAEKPSSDRTQTCLRTEMQMSQITSQTTVVQESNASKTVTVPLMPTTMPTADTTNVEKNKIIPAEPYCQTPKEKECWHLYRRMCDKGVFVSFDTVLRGMLTPTEYRLRQKELSQNC